MVNPTWRLLVGDVREQLRALPDTSAQCVVTSPPYWGLRDYGHEGQIGLERTPDAYVEQMVAVFREVRRVLKDDGTLWLNLGDTYAMDTKWGGKSGRRHTAEREGAAAYRLPRSSGLKSKDLVGIPWRAAFALQADGWYLRNDIVWSKPNPMPESVTDRCTKSHEYIFLMAKSERYFYDADAVAEPASLAMQEQMEQGYQGLGLKDYEGVGVQNPSTVKARIIANARAKHRQTDPQAAGHRIVNNVAAARAAGAPHDNPFGITRNLRTVWTITTQPYPEAHFATFPEEIPERCIKAGSRVGDVVLDPFAGSGTTGQVAAQLGRSFVGIELNLEYARLAGRRLRGRARSGDATGRPPRRLRLRPRRTARPDARSDQGGRVRAGAGPGVGASAVSGVQEGDRGVARGAGEGVDGSGGGAVNADSP